MKESATENEEYRTFIAALTNVQDAESQTDLDISLNKLILSETKLRDYYRYEGSQTIPGCSETAIWTMFKEPIPLSTAQLAAFFNLKSTRVELEDSKFLKTAPLSKLENQKY
ncbi:carbonic anhydrase 4-like [Tachysurus fulvidraco]|uniref:carbonic anhydrase 4-like n=1 Tax=Tachysurus fulvidraco TaxID=1234273 RepID=UPI001FEEBC26|nr:carbonic anhydrase 4-like [Tachysurus fulvidraco]